MSDWLHALPVGWMAVVVLGGTYLAAAGIYSLVMAIAKGERARAFKAVSPGLLSPLGIIFGLFVAFLAAQVWSDLDRAGAAVNGRAQGSGRWRPRLSRSPPFPIYVWSPVTLRRRPAPSRSP